MPGEGHAAEIAGDERVSIEEDEGLGLGQRGQRLDLVALRIGGAEMPGLEGQDRGAELLQQAAHRGGDPRLAGPERPRLRLGHEERAGEVGRGMAQRGGEQHRLVFQPAALGDDHQVERGGEGRGHGPSLGNSRPSIGMPGGAESRKRQAGVKRSERQDMPPSSFAHSELPIRRTS